MTGSSLFRTDTYLHSRKLRRGLSGFSGSALAVIDFHLDGALRIATADAVSGARPSRIAPPRGPAGALLRMERMPLEDADLDALEPLRPREGREAGGGGRWLGFSGVFEEGRRDVLALWLGQAEDPALTARMLGKIWPVLREDCLQEVTAPEDGTAADGRSSGPAAETRNQQTGDDALLWMISDRLDVAVFVLDGQCRMLRVNLAARRLLAEGRILCRGKGGLFGATEADSRMLRSAVAACSTSKAEDTETVIFLDAPEGRRVPMTLSRFVYKGTPTGHVVAMLPLPPDSDRVEMVGRGMGLTSVEARVASLIQLGLSNREAAARAGIREQTFNTYAKRALAKLNVSCRAEMAQILTWQAAGGRKQ